MFDAIGLWRENAKVGDKEEPIDPGGTFPDGEVYQDYEGFKTLLMKHKDKLAKSLVEGIMSYGLGRNIEFSDQDEIDKLTKLLIEDQYRAKSLIHNLVQSPAFQTK